jgi:flagellar motor protein MotB
MRCERPRPLILIERFYGELVMRWVIAAHWPLVACLPLVLGCGQNAVTLSRQNQSLLTQQQTLAQRNQELQTRASALDQDNQELEALLAQSRQRIQLLGDEMSAVRDELRATTGQLAQLRTENQGLEKKTQAFAASMQRQRGTEIRANNGLISSLSVIHLPGVEVRQDGDVIRIELPGEKLFMAGDAHLKPEAAALIDSVAADLARNYPDQIIGVEGHTDNVPIQTRQYPTNHHLATARAIAVYDHLVSRGQFRPDQMFVVAHGANRPVVSNATSAGKARNRRVELVVYPEKHREP